MLVTYTSGTLCMTQNRNIVILGTLPLTLQRESSSKNSTE